MGLKSENEKKECGNKMIPLMFCTRLINLHCQKNYELVLKCHTSQPPDPGGASLPRALHGLEGGDISEYV